MQPDRHDNGSPRDKGTADVPRMRKSWMAVLARAGAAELDQILASLPHRPAYTVLKGPEIGTAMVQARAGGSGRRFNLGEATMTRCAVRLEDGTTGYSYALGRDRGHAERAAVLDALLQGEGGEKLLERHVCPLSEAQREAKRLAACKAAATKVDFFTMVRGEG